MTRARRSGLGKGLDALFMDNDTNDTGVVTLRLRVATVLKTCSLERMEPV